MPSYACFLAVRTQKRTVSSSHSPILPVWPLAMLLFLSSKTKQKSAGWSQSPWDYLHLLPVKYRPNHLSELNLANSAFVGLVPASCAISSHKVALFKSLVHSSQSFHLHRKWSNSLYPLLTHSSDIWSNIPYDQTSTTPFLLMTSSVDSL